MHYLISSPYQSPVYVLDENGERTWLEDRPPTDELEPDYRYIRTVPDTLFPVYRLDGGNVRYPWFGTVSGGRVLDWAGIGDGERTDSLYSARALELDGVADYVNMGDLGTLPKAVAKIEYQAKRGVANSSPRFRLNSGTDLTGATLIRPGVWEDGEIILGTATADASEVWLGRNGSGYSDCQLANVRLLAADGEVLARYLLNEHPAGDVNGLPALDSSGNGLHGSYVGGLSVTGIGVGADFRGLAEYGDYMWFSSLQNNWLTNISVPGLSNGAAWELDADVYFNPTATGIPFVLSHTSATFGYFFQLPSSGALVFASAKCIPGSQAISAPRNAWYRLRLSFDGNVTYSFRVNNTVAKILTLNDPLDPIPLNETLRISLNLSQRWSGAFRNIKINGTLIATGKGLTSAAWGGGTVSGNPATIAEYRRTPPQVGMGAWNLSGTELRPSQLSNPTLDALGNPITVPRISPTAFHSPTASDVLRVDKSAVRSMSFWFYHDGQARTLFSNANLTLSVDALGQVSTTSGTLTQDLAPVQDTWLFTHLNLPSAVNLTDFQAADGLVDDIQVYDQELSAEQIARNKLVQQETYA
jgi:hypothetical protein